ncbi:hypothetical protein QJS66_02120 [Kocuria rhizophila]|nr:hypothetical protein QJS66_02120 [Kocuria rhizophila]
MGAARRGGVSTPPGGDASGRPRGRHRRRGTPDPRRPARNA